MMENNRELVAWVGVAQAEGENSIFFLPHGAPSDPLDRKNFAKQLMVAIVRFARENSRQGDNRDFESASQAALLAELASDFRDHGLFTIRENVRSRDNGKPDWSRTVKSQVAFPAANGAPVYCEISSTRHSTFSTNIVARIQAQIIVEISLHHGWWMDRYFGAREIPVPPPLNDWPREAWPRLLKMARRELFQNRAIRLVQMMLDYLEHTRETGLGNVVCGISDFSSMWEAVLRRTLDGVEDDWNSRLPGPRYFGLAGSGDPAGRMQLDIVVRRNNRIIILDAKYYRSTSIGFVPGLPDIMKQVIYQKAMESTGVEFSGIENAFLFPAEQTRRDPYHQIRFIMPDGTDAEGFPPIDCQYVSIANVIDAYARGTKLDDQKWL